MAISVVSRLNAADSNGTAGFVTAAFTTNTAGNTIIAIGLCPSRVTSMSTPTDTKGNTYTLIASGSNGTSVSYNVWAVYNIPVSAGTNTVTMNDSNIACGLFIYEIAGLATSAAFDKTMKTAGTSVLSMTSGSTLTLGFNNELVLGGFVTNSTSGGTFTVGGGFSNLLQQNPTNGGNQATEEQIVSTGASIAATATAALSASNGNDISFVVTFSDTAIVPRAFKFNNSGLRPHPFSPGLAR